jgi:hypothetical protein
MQCPECELENEAGAYYCARCHKPLPRPAAPGTCPCCGAKLDPDSVRSGVCSTCNNDAAKGAELKAQRQALALAEVEAQTKRVDSERARMDANKTRRGCLPLTILALLVVLAGALGQAGDRGRCHKGGKPACVGYQFRNRVCGGQPRAGTADFVPWWQRL